MKTGFESNGRDLGSIFKKRKKGDSVVAPTGFMCEGIDLSEIFAPYTGGKKAKPVGYAIADGRDLSEIFAFDNSDEEAALAAMLATIAAAT
jgi:hypothetical protein